MNKLPNLTTVSKSKVQPRARKSTLELEKLLKEFRKVSVENQKNKIAIYSPLDFSRGLF